MSVMICFCSYYLLCIHSTDLLLMRLYWAWGLLLLLQCIMVPRGGRWRLEFLFEGSVKVHIIYQWVWEWVCRSLVSLSAALSAPLLIDTPVILTLAWRRKKQCEYNHMSEIQTDLLYLQAHFLQGIVQPSLHLQYHAVKQWLAAGGNNCNCLWSNKVTVHLTVWRWVQIV